MALVIESRGGKFHFMTRCRFFNANSHESIRERDVNLIFMRRHKLINF